MVEMVWLEPHHPILVEMAVLPVVEEALQARLVVLEALVFQVVAVAEVTINKVGQAELVFTPAVVAVQLNGYQIILAVMAVLVMAEMVAMALRVTLMEVS